MGCVFGGGGVCAALPDKSAAETTTARVDFAFAAPQNGRFCVLSKGRELAVLTTEVGDGVAW